MNLEDETGMVNVLCSQGDLGTQPPAGADGAGAGGAGIVQNASGAVTVVADGMRPLDLRVGSRSRDFR